MPIMESNARVDMVDIKKSFGAIEALRGVTLSIQPGEVVGLVGDNGAGKSTLMKMLAGAEIPDSGRMLVDGVALDKAGPREARERGI